MSPTPVYHVLLPCHWELSAQPFRACVIGELTARSLGVRAYVLCVWVSCCGALHTVATILLSTTILQAVAMLHHVLWELSAQSLHRFRSGELTAQSLCIPGGVLRVLRGLNLPLALCSMGLQDLLHCFIMQCLAHVTIPRPVAGHCTRRRVVPFVSFFRRPFLSDP